MGAGTPLIPSPYFMKTYPRVSYPVNRFTAGSSRSLLKTQNKPVVVNCCVGPADDVSNKGWSYWKFKGDIRRWCDKQSLPVGAAVYILVEAIQSAVFGFVWKMLGDHLIFEILSGLEQRRHYFGMYYPLVLCFFGRPLLVGRSYAVIKACTFGTAYVMKRLRPNEEGSDLLT
ncbi:hypothetical protein QVD17_04143 [Tagetes erecta]|uniref:Uncharacterized protein n=1 Tax=Tagetes erecta TaxID=13708 RepID=A0AAD8L9L7_TARER|nr:hypothetical protein QVD17_04143 [Tagetes erecta]